MSTSRPPIEPVQQQSPDIRQEQVEWLRERFPHVFAEGRIDFDKLRAALGDQVDDRPERYTFSWAGKRDAIRLLQTPSRATLIPDRAQSVSFDATQHLFIEGDNLEVLKLLYKAYFGRVKMIYIDPPYNTGNDFIYRDDYADPLATYLQFTGQADQAGNLLTSNPETGGRYHSAWLSMMYPRLFLARQLLREDGVIFVSIDDHEVHNLRLLMNEIFGEENFVATVIWQKIFAPKNTARHLSEDHDYIVMYARSADVWRPTLLPRTASADARYANPDQNSRGAWSSGDLTARNYYSEGQYEVTSPSGRKFQPPRGRYWVVSHNHFMELSRDNRIWWGSHADSMPRLKRFLSEVQQGIVPQTLWEYEDVGHTQEAKKELLDFVPFEFTENVLNTVKPTRLIQRMLQIATAPASGDTVLDFFAGSASTAHAVMKQNHEDDGNRRLIMVQLPELLPTPEATVRTIADIGKERIRRVIARLSAETASQLPLDTRPTPEDLGFRVFKLGPSHFQPWTGAAETAPAAYAQQMSLFTDPLAAGWTPEAVIYEVALKEGYGLTCHIEDLHGQGQEGVYRVTDPDRDQTFLISLADTLTADTVAALNLSKDDLFICRDVALTDDLAANLALQCRLKTI